MDNKKINNLSGGCASKIDPAFLSTMLSNFTVNKDENMLVSFDFVDDACVYKLSDDLALVNTLDFFPPLVDDPYIFGQIAATNALSDVYAMGGEPKIAMNIVCFPQNEDKDILEEILRGGLDKINEAGAVLAGGHSIYDEKIKYGLSVSGIVNPNKIWQNNKAEVGDILFFTKKIGSALITTAHKNNATLNGDLDIAIKYMTILNKYAYEIMKNYNIHSCTDVTGFSFLGHSVEMVKNNDKISFEYSYTSIPKMTKNVEMYAKKGYICSGSIRNRKHFSKYVDLSSLTESQIDVLFDPQTSGGLLFAVSKEEAEKIRLVFKEKNLELFEVGRVVERKDYLIKVNIKKD